MKNNKKRNGFCIYITSICNGPTPSVCDGDGNPVVFKTKHEAQREIADNAITRLQEFIDGQRDFEDAMTIEEYIVSIKTIKTGDIVAPV